MTATITPPIVTWISDAERDTSRKRLRMSIVRRVKDGGGRLLWDTRGDDHHHLVCRRCGRVEDIDTPLDLEGARRSAKRMGFAPDHAEVVVSGLCAACAPQ